MLLHFAWRYDTHENQPMDCGMFEDLSACKEYLENRMEGGDMVTIFAPVARTIVVWEDMK